MIDKRTVKLQQPDYSRHFVNIPLKFIKQLKWVKGQELFMELRDNELLNRKKPE